MLNEIKIDDLEPKENGEDDDFNVMRKKLDL